MWRDCHRPVVDRLEKLQLLGRLCGVFRLLLVRADRIVITVSHAQVLIGQSVRAIVLRPLLAIPHARRAFSGTFPVGVGSMLLLGDYTLTLSASPQVLVCLLKRTEG